MLSDPDHAQAGRSVVPEKKQELIQKILNLIKQGQSELNEVEVEAALDTATVKSLTRDPADTKLLDKLEIFDIFTEASIEEVEDAINSVTIALEAEPIFSTEKIGDHSLLRLDDDADEDTEQDIGIDDLIVGAIGKLPKEVQEGIKTGYETVMEG